MQKTNSLGKILMLGKSEGKRRRGQQRMKLLDNITEMDMKLSKLWKIVKNSEARVLHSMGLQRVRHYLTTGTTTIRVVHTLI